MVSVPPEARIPLGGLEPDDTGADEPRRAAKGWAGRLEIAIPVTLLVVIVAACFLLPIVYPVPKPVSGNIIDAELPPLSPGHLLGTDTVGNDVFSRLLYGGRVSLLIAVAVNLIGLVLGGLLGAFSAYRGGAMDTVIMRFLDVLIAFPSLVLALAIAQSLGPSVNHTIFALSFFSVPAFARTARATTLRLREQTFVTAARLCGARTSRVLFRHIAPNILPQLMTFALLSMGIVIVVEGALSFLQLGVPPPSPSWGNMIYQGQQSISTTPLLVLFPSIVLFVTTLAFNLLGDAMRARWNTT
jgi:peptide/nickel transport system permease protein